MHVYKMGLTDISHNIYKCIDEEGIGKTMRVPESAFGWMSETGEPHDYHDLKALLLSAWDGLDTNFELVLDEMDMPVLQNIPSEAKEEVL